MQLIAARILGCCYHVLELSRCESRDFITQRWESASWRFLWLLCFKYERGEHAKCSPPCLWDCSRSILPSYLQRPSSTVWFERLGAELSRWICWSRCARFSQAAWPIRFVGLLRLVRGLFKHRYYAKQAIRATHIDSRKRTHSVYIASFSHALCLM